MICGIHGQPVRRTSCATMCYASLMCFACRRVLFVCVDFYGEYKLVQRLINEEACRPRNGIRCIQAAAAAAAAASLIQGGTEHGTPEGKEKLLDIARRPMAQVIRTHRAIQMGSFALYSYTFTSYFTTQHKRIEKASSVCRIESDSGLCEFCIARVQVGKSDSISACMLGPRG